MALKDDSHYLNFLMGRAPDILVFTKASHPSNSHDFRASQKVGHLACPTTCEKLAKVVRVRNEAKWPTSCLVRKSCELEGWLAFVKTRITQDTHDSQHTQDRQDRQYTHDARTRAA
jgi:hypothetical protein